MNIAISGSTGRVGREIVKSLSPNYQITPLGRKNGDVPWSLGINPAPEDLQAVGAIIHLAWSMYDREKDWHLNVGGTLSLASIAQKLDIPFLFISSVAALGDSNYGSSKRAAESNVISMDGSCVRIGIIRGINRYALKSKFINPVLNSKRRVNFTDYEDLKLYLHLWLTAAALGETKQQVDTIVSGSEITKVFFRNENQINIPVSPTLLEIFTKPGSRFSRRISNSYDALVSLKTTPEIK